MPFVAIPLGAPATSPVVKVLATDYYDGAKAGLALCDDGSFASFRLLDWDDDHDLRVFEVSILRRPDGIQLARDLFRRLGSEQPMVLVPPEEGTAIRAIEHAPHQAADFVVATDGLFACLLRCVRAPSEAPPDWFVFLGLDRRGVILTRLDSAPSRLELTECDPAARTPEATIRSLGDPTLGDRRFLLCVLLPKAVAMQAHIHVYRGFPRPQACLVRDSFLLGFNSTVAFIDTRTGSMESERELASPFREFLQAADVLVVVHEIGALRLGEDLSPMWEFSRDIVEDVDLQRDSLLLTFMDEPDVRLRLSDGRPM